MNRFTIAGAIAIMLGVTFSSCEKDSPVIKEKANIKTTVLLYAVASNNLYGNLIEDKNEILQAARKINLDELKMLVYQVTPNGSPSLLEVKRFKPDSCGYEVIREYDREFYSTDPRRISEVIDYVKSNYDSDLYGLVLWSHGTGLDPFVSTRSSEDGSHPMMHSFGSDKDPDKDASYSDQINIDELADAIPNNLFNYIWFDACYMSGIETIYELRNKCRYFVGYPTEVFTPGMPYHLTLPYILAETPNLIGGAETFFNFYAEYPRQDMQVATVCVVDMDELEGVADYCKMAYSGNSAPSASGLLKYTRGSIGPFYDFVQYTRLMAYNNPDCPAIEEFEGSLSKFILYSAATELDFNYRPIDIDNFSGISCHLFVDDDSKKSKFYKTLDWYKRVYE